MKKLTGKITLCAFVIGSVVAVTAACGGNEGNRSKTTGTTPAGSAATDLMQKASLTSPAETNVAQPAVVETPARPVRHMLVLADGKTGFRVNSKTLSDEAKAKIDEMFSDGKVDLKDARFEIEGHTDNLGSKEVNDRIGLERAEAVRQYICEKYEVPMESISVVSYGLEKPVADNATPEGRAQNRRVVIKVVD